MTNNYDSMSVITEYATKTNDMKILCKINEKRTNCEPVPYQRLCKIAYRTHAQTLLNKKNTEWHKHRNMHAIAFRKLCIFILNSIVKEKNCYFLKYLQQFLQQFSKEEFKESEVDNADIFDTHHAKKKIFTQRKFKGKIRAISCGAKIIIAPYNVTAINNIDELQKEFDLQAAALTEVKNFEHGQTETS